jgi:hypothetical protein
VVVVRWSVSFVGVVAIDRLAPVVELVSRCSRVVVGVGCPVSLPVS